MNKRPYKCMKHNLTFSKPLLYGPTLGHSVLYFISASLWPWFFVFLNRQLNKKRLEVYMLHYPWNLKAHFLFLRTVTSLTWFRRLLNLNMHSSFLSLCLHALRVYILLQLSVYIWGWYSEMVRPDTQCTHSPQACVTQMTGAKKWLVALPEA